MFVAKNGFEIRLNHEIFPATRSLNDDNADSTSLFVIDDKEESLPQCIVAAVMENHPGDFRRPPRQIVLEIMMLVLIVKASGSALATAPADGDESSGNK
jgi:hypothetical protein